jgi:hypothetical protein
MPTHHSLLVQLPMTSKIAKNGSFESDELTVVGYFEEE